jgi:hypothetical protein
MSECESVSKTVAELPISTSGYDAEKIKYSLSINFI